MFYPRVLLSAAARSAQRPLMTRMAAPAVFSRLYASLSKDTIESRILEILRGFEKVDANKVNGYTCIFIYLDTNFSYNRWQLNPTLSRISA